MSRHYNIIFTNKETVKFTKVKPRKVGSYTLQHIRNLKCTCTHARTHAHTHACTHTHTHTTHTPVHTCCLQTRTYTTNGWWLTSWGSWDKYCSDRENRASTTSYKGRQDRWGYIQLFHVHTTSPASHVSTNSHSPFLVQWSLSIKDAIGTQLAVLYREVSLIQR